MLEVVSSDGDLAASSALSWKRDSLNLFQHIEEEKLTNHIVKNERRSLDA